MKTFFQKQGMHFQGNFYVSTLDMYFEYIIPSVAHTLKWAKIRKMYNLGMPHCLYQRLKSMFFEFFKGSGPE